jgi:hypothetical protein
VQCVVAPSAVVFVSDVITGTGAGTPTGVLRAHRGGRRCGGVDIGEAREERRVWRRL